MNTVSLRPTTVLRSEYLALQGQPMHRTYALLDPGRCPACGSFLKAAGYADWVKDHGIVVTLWNCFDTRCRAFNSTFRLETRLVDDTPQSVQLSLDQAPAQPARSAGRPEPLVEFEQQATSNLTNRLQAGQDIKTAVKQLGAWKMRWTRGWTASGRYTAADIRAAWQRAQAAAQEAVR